MQMVWLGIAIAGAAAYHIVLKLTPAGANPYLSLAVTYAVTTLVFCGWYAAQPGSLPLRAAVGQLNWTAVVLGIVIVFLDLGFMMLYRGGFELSLAQLVTQSATALLLLIIGVAWFGDKLSFTNLAGIVLCVIGLWLINRR